MGTLVKEGKVGVGGNGVPWAKPRVVNEDWEETEEGDPRGSKVCDPFACRDSFVIGKVCEPSRVDDEASA